jgi:hypothetical protein
MKYRESKIFYILLLTGNNLALNVWEKWKINLLTGNNLALNVWEK